MSSIYLIGSLRNPKVREVAAALRDAGHLLIRDSMTGRPMFWPWQINAAEEITTRSSRGCPNRDP